LLTRIHVLDGNVDRALETLELFRLGRQGAVSPCSLEVAQAAEKSRPRDAIRLYLEEIDRLIHGRGRANYAQAARCLLRVRAVHNVINDQAGWQQLIARIREENRRLSALQDELNLAGL
jgi:uncharacterized Zn finger protein